MKRINENQKITLTIGQLKKLIKESLEGDSAEATVDIALGLPTEMSVGGETFSTIDVLQVLFGDFATDRWEFEPDMDPWYVFYKELTQRGSDIILKVREDAADGDYENPYLDPSGQPDVKKIRRWMAKAIKILAFDEVDRTEWNAASDMTTEYFGENITVGMIFTVYKALLK